MLSIRPHRRALTVTALATLLAWVVWTYTIMTTDPDAAGALRMILFAVSLFGAVSGSALLVGLFARRREPDRVRATGIAIRQGMLIGIAVIAAVLLSMASLLTWFNLIALIAALTLLELFIISLRVRHESTNGHESTNAV